MEQTTFLFFIFVKEINGVVGKVFNLNLEFLYQYGIIFVWSQNQI